MARILYDPEKTLFIVDVSSFIFRAFYAVMGLKSPEGIPTNAVHGVLSMLGQLFSTQPAPKHVLIACDSKEPSFRKTLYEAYKSNRSAPPEDLIVQFPLIDEAIKLLNIPSVRKPGYEADDLIATFTKQWIQKDSTNIVYIVSGDKDLMQLVTDRVFVWDTMKDMVYQPAGVLEKFGCPPDLMRDYLALVGDSSDFVPGVPSIGPKTAVQLISMWGALTEILSAAEQGKIEGKKGQVLKEFKQTALLSYELVTLKEDVTLDTEWWDGKSLDSRLVYHRESSSGLQQFFQQYGLKAAQKKWEQILSLPASGASTQPLVTSTHAQPVTASTHAQPVTASTHASPQAVPETALPINTQPIITATTPPAFIPRSVTTKAEWKELLEKIKSIGEFSFDTETAATLTSALDSKTAECVGISLACSETEGFYIPFKHAEQVTDPAKSELTEEIILKDLQELVMDPGICMAGQNLKFDLGILKQRGIEPKCKLFDTMVADYVLNPEEKHNLESLAQRYFQYQTLNFVDLFPEKTKNPDFRTLSIEQATRYSAEDAWMTWCLFKKLRSLLKQQGQVVQALFDNIEEPLVPVLLDMETAGVKMNLEEAKKIQNELESQARVVLKKAYELIGKEINLNSPKQLAQVLFEDLKLPVQGKNKTGYSTDADTLEVLAKLHEFPKLVLENREIKKLLGTYIEPIESWIHPVTGRVHSSFHQTVTATGRLSSTDPNLQNIPIRTKRGKWIRKLFCADQDKTLIAGDYSQIELRILAHMSDDPGLKEAFLNLEDIHVRTASKIFSVDVSDISSEQRSAAKAINFGLMYGKSAFALAGELEISRTEAKSLMEAYFAQFPKIKDFLNDLIATAKTQGYSETLLGRRRYLPDLNSKNAAMRAHAERMAMNAPIQGTASDLIKAAMITIHKELTHLNASKGFSKLILQVHDELVVECDRSVKQEVVQLLKVQMENALKNFGVQFSVPIIANLEEGQNWLEMDTVQTS